MSQRKRAVSLARSRPTERRKAMAKSTAESKSSRDHLTKGGRCGEQRHALTADYTRLNSYRVIDHHCHIPHHLLPSTGRPSPTPLRPWRTVRRSCASSRKSLPCRKCHCAVSGTAIHSSAFIATAAPPFRSLAHMAAHRQFTTGPCGLRSCAADPMAPSKSSKPSDGVLR